MEITTVQIGSVSLVTHYEYDPPSPPVYYGKDGAGSPGTPAEYEIKKIMFNDQDVTDLIFELIDFYDFTEKLEAARKLFD